MSFSQRLSIVIIFSALAGMMTALLYHGALQ